MSNYLGNILLVEDDDALATSIVEYLQNEGFAMQREGHGSKAVERIVQLNPDLVILDIMLPGKDGITICREVRPQFDGVILMFTAKDDEIEQIVGLEVGADDYLVKPVKPRLLLAKLKSLMRRNERSASNEQVSAPLALGTLTIDNVARTVMLAEVLVCLTAAEFDLLALLAARAGQIMTRDDIAQQLSATFYDGFERTIDNKVSILRKKLGDDARAPSKIKTVRSKGYVLVPTAF